MTNTTQTGLTITNDVLNIDMKILLNAGYPKNEITKTIVDYAVENANSISDLNRPNLTIAFINMPKTIEAIDMPDDMTGKELREHNELVNRANEIATYALCKTQELTYDITSNIISDVIGRLHPELTELDVNNILTYVYYAFRVDSDFFCNVADVTELVVATRKNKKIFAQP